MLIVIEGCDGVGKTSLARDLCERTGAEYRHLGPPQAHPLEEYVLPLDGYQDALARMEEGEQLGKIVLQH